MISTEHLRAQAKATTFDQLAEGSTNKVEPAASAESYDANVEG